MAKMNERFEAEAPYLFIGNLWLEEPQQHLSIARQHQLRALELFLRELECQWLIGTWTETWRIPQSTWY